MALTHIPLEQITEDHLVRLIDAKAAESLHIEYKRETYGGADDQRREFLADISSFANSSGGDLIIGMVATNGVPTELHPFVGDSDAEKLRLEQMARDGLQPRISKLQSAAVPVHSGGCVLVVRVPQSYNRPHRVIFKNAGRFWARSSAGKYEPNVDELRRIFVEAPLLAERIRTFRIDRISQIAAGETPVILAGTCMMVLHVIPYSAFDRTVPLVLPGEGQRLRLFPPLGRNVGTHHYVNLDGFVVLSDANEGVEQRHHSYAQVFRSGIIEGVSTMDRQDGSICAYEIHEYCVKYTRLYVGALTQLGVEPPTAVIVSLIGVAGRKLASGIDGLYAPHGIPQVRQNQIHFAEVIIEDAPTSFSQSAELLFPLLEQIWNSAGFDSVPPIRFSSA